MRAKRGFRVRGSLRESDCHDICGSSPSPRPLPVRMGRGRRPQFSILYPVAFTIGCQNAVLAASSLVRPSALLPTGIRPIAVSFSFTSGLASAALAAAPSLLANSGELPAGNHKPDQAPVTKTVALSFKVGTSEAKGERSALLTAMIFTPLARCCASASASVVIPNGTWAADEVVEDSCAAAIGHAAQGNAEVLLQLRAHEMRNGAAA